MSTDVNYPTTTGQLSVWRDVQRLSPERLWEANLTMVWNVDVECSVADVREALGTLAMHHESLRTTYLADDDGGLRQRITGSDPDTVLAQVYRGTADSADRATLEQELAQQHGFDVTSELPWRAWVLTDGERPRQVLVVVHHIAADAAALLILGEDLNRVLAGTPLPARRTPRELAEHQHGDGRSRIEGAERYWRRTLAAAPRRTDRARPSAATPLGATLHTGIPLWLAHERAAALEVSLATVMIGAYQRAVRAVTGPGPVLMYPMSANRFDPEMAGVVSSLNQWAVLVLDHDDGEPFDAVVRKLHWKSFNAFKNGRYDTDAVRRIRDEYDAADPPVDAGYHFNALIAPTGEPGVESRPSTVEWYTPPRVVGADFYLIVRAISTVEIVLRVKRPEFDRDRLGRFLDSFQHTLDEVCQRSGARS